MAATMFIFLAFLIGSSSALICREQRRINLLDCSGLQLVFVPHFKQPQIWVRALDLRRNDIVSVNFSSLLVDFPNLQRLDLRQNPYDCASLDFIEVRSDCVTPVTVVTPAITLLPTRPSARYVTLTYESVPTTHHAGNTTKSHVLLISLVSSSVLALGFPFPLCIVLKRRNRRTNNIEQFALAGIQRSSFSSSDSELIVFDRESPV